MITPNETLQLNELLALKSLSLTKSLLMSPMITDPKLKEIFTRESGLCEQHIRELRGFMEKSNVESIQNVNMFSQNGGDAT